MTRLSRGAGIIMPISALPGAGDFGSAVRWLHWMNQAAMRYWQILPLTIPDSVGSPFASPSAEAMNPAFLSLSWLADDGLVASRDAKMTTRNPRDQHRRRMNVLDQAYRIWRREHQNEQAAFAAWRSTQTWLWPYCSYQAIKDQYGGRPWWLWPARWRRGRTAVQRLTPLLHASAERHAWIQWMLDRQWQRLRREAKRRGITIIGDLPFYVQYDSVDVWFRPELFLLDERGKMKFVSGAAPDVFSATGQKWGTPVYRWSVHQREQWAWWIDRIANGLQLYDVIRFDHFPGLQATWRVPVKARTGAAGRWVPTPGRELLRSVKKHFGYLPFLAEDLGRVSKFISTLRDDFDIPGSRVLQFAWSGLPDNFHEPKNVGTNMVYYTANHDTNTTNGWFQDEAKPYEREHVRQYFGSTTNLPEKFISTVMRHRAKIAMLHIADVLGLGSEARINHPGTIGRNWTWRLKTWPSNKRAQRLRRLAFQTQRARRTRS